MPVQTLLHFSLRMKDPLATAIPRVGEEEERIPSSKDLRESEKPTCARSKALKTGREEEAI